MGVIYIPLPLAHEAAQQLLADSGLPSPPPVESRYPTHQELRQVLTNLPGYDVEYRVTEGPHAYWEADVSWSADAATGPWIVVRVQPFDPDERGPTPFCFSKGWPETVVLILERLAQVCGPFVMVDDSAMEPLVVTPGLDIGQALAEWNSRVE